MPGRFFALDGADGAGKSTQVAMLVGRLRAGGFAVAQATDPGGTELGAALRELLLHRREIPLSLRAEALLFMASRAQLVAEVIAPALARGGVVVSDRFATANVVYQGHAGGLDPAELWELAAFSTGGVTPDLTLVFDVDAATAGLRAKPKRDRLESRGPDYWERVRAGFRSVVAASPGSYRLIDATGPAEAVHELVWAAVSPLLSDAGGEAHAV